MKDTELLDRQQRSELDDDKLEEIRNKDTTARREI